MYFCIIDNKKNMNAMTGNNQKLGKKTIDKLIFIIPEFAATFKMNMAEAYCYLVRYVGFEFLTKHWRTLHTDNKYWKLLDIYDICHK